MGHRERCRVGSEMVAWSATESHYKTLEGMSRNQEALRKNGKHTQRWGTKRDMGYGVMVRDGEAQEEIAGSGQKSASTACDSGAWSEKKGTVRNKVALRDIVVTIRDGRAQREIWGALPETESRGGIG